MVMDTLSGSFQSRSSEISKDLTSVILKKLDETRVEIFNRNPDIVKLKTAATSQKSDANNIKSELSNLNLDFDSDGFRVSDLEISAAGIKGNVASLKTYLADKINVSLDNIIDAKNELSGIANVSGTSDVSAELDLIEIDLKLAQNKTNELSASSTNEINLIISLLSATSSKISDVQVQITDVTNARVSVDSKVDSLVLGLDESFKILEGIQTSFSNIDKNIASIPVSSAENIVSPITTVIKPVSVKGTHLNYVFPSLIVLIIMFISILLASTLVMMEKHSPAYFRNFITPVSNLTYVLSMYLTTLFLVILQIIIILGISSYFFKAHIVENIFHIGSVLLLLSSVFILLGMLIGYMFSSEETGTLASISAGSIFLFLSDLILPLESMPAYILKIARFNPFVIGQNILRKAIIFGTKIDVMADEVYLLIIYCVLLIVAIFMTSAFLRQTIFSKWSYRRFRRKDARIKKKIEDSQKKKSDDKSHSKKSKEHLKKEINKITKSKNKKENEKNGKNKKDKVFFFGELSKEHDKDHSGGGFFKYLRKK